MATLKQIRRRIRSVENTRQITKAMEMVAAAKLRRAQQRAESIRPYTSKMREVLQSLASSASIRTDPLFQVREVAREGWILLASDKGLCGSYNVNVSRELEKRIKGRDSAGVYLIPVGRRINDYFRRRAWEMDGTFRELGDQLDLNLASGLARRAVQLYREGALDRIRVVYTHFISAASRKVVEEQLLPIEPPQGSEGGLEYIFEPSAHAILGALLPRYVEGLVRTALSEALASEHSTRMLAMGNATRNAEDMIRTLTLVGNKLRQAAITKEISEIVGGAEALK